jgi:hypothetical protein
MPGTVHIPLIPFCPVYFPIIAEIYLFLVYFTAVSGSRPPRPWVSAAQLSSAYVVPTHTHARNSAREEGCCARLAFTAAHAKAAARNAGS